MNASTPAPRTARRGSRFLPPRLGVVGLAPVLLLALVLVPASPAFADSVQVGTDQFIQGLIKGETETELSFEAFGELARIPKKFLTRINKSNPNGRGAGGVGGQAGAAAEMARGEMDRNNFGAAKGLFAQAFAQDNTDGNAASGHLYFTISQLTTNALANEKQGLAAFVKYRPGYSRVFEYTSWILLRLKASLVGRRGRAVATKLQRALKKYRKKLLGLARRGRGKAKDLDQLAEVCLAIYERPYSERALVEVKALGDLTKRLRIMRKVAEAYRVLKQYDERTSRWSKGFEDTITPAMVGREPRFNPRAKDNDAIRAANAKDSAGMAEREFALFVATNDYREALGLMRLRARLELVTAARVHTKDMAAGKFLEHKGSDGSQPWTRAERAGFPQRSLVAENIQRAAKADDDVQLVLARWRHSPGHHKIICRADLVYFGAATEGVYWTQVFGTPAVAKNK